MAPISVKQDGQVPVLTRSSNRTITSKMTPGVASTPYWKIIANEGSSLLPEPILSIIQLKLLPGLSVLVTTSPAARLWTTSLEYVSSIPGCSTIFWGTRKLSNESRPALQGEELCLLITWESSLHWAKFQDSFGLLLMREVLVTDEGISNRCIQMTLPMLPNSSTSLSLASFVFDSKVSGQKCDRFTEQFGKWSHERVAEGVSVCGAWLEGDAAWPTPRLAPDRLAALERSQSELRNSQDRIFVVLIFEHNDTSNINHDSVEQTLKIGSQSGQLRRFSLEKQTPNLDSNFDIKPSNLPSPTTLASLLSHASGSQYSFDTGMSHNIDHVHETSVQDFYYKTRLFPGPRGEMRTKMGDMCQYGPRYSNHATTIEEVAVDIVEIGIEQRFFEAGGDRQKEASMRQSLTDFKCNVKEMDGCEEMYWAKNEDGGGCAAIVYWTSPAARTSNSQFLHRLKQDLITNLTTRDQTKYSDTSNTLTAPGTSTPQSMRGHMRNNTVASIMTVATTIPSSIRTRRSSKSPRSSFPLLEITTFEIPNEPQTLELFRVFYNAFQMTSSLNARVVTQAIPLACHTADFTLSPSPSHSSSAITSSLATPPSTPPNGFTNDRVLFTALIGWKSHAAMTEWYTSFSSPSASYERLGHKIDALSSLGLENIQSRVLTVTSDVFGARRTVMWDEESTRKRRSVGGVSLFAGSFVSMRSQMGMGREMRENAQRDKRREREKRLSTLSQWTSKGS